MSLIKKRTCKSCGKHELAQLATNKFQIKKTKAFINAGFRFVGSVCLACGTLMLDIGRFRVRARVEVMKNGGREGFD
jgi:hypothetical protein